MRILSVRPRGGGGASRDGAELLLERTDGSRIDAYMNHDVNKSGAGDDDAFLREAAILRALSGPLSSSGVAVAPFIAAIPELRTLVAGRVEGESNFHMAGEDRDAVARDFIAQVAALHRIDPTQAEGLPQPRTIADVAAKHIARLDQRIADQPDDALAQLARRWLSTHVPPEPARLTIVHGDAGPANFLYSGAKVTAILDWELVHIGDPMADFAMMALRNLFQPFIPIPQALAIYRQEGGEPIDLDRLRYWRILFQAGFTSEARYTDPAAPPPPNLGMNMVYTQVHRRVLTEALAEVMDVDLPAPILPDPGPGTHDRSFDIAAADLRDFIVPRIADQQAAVKAKGLARLVKWWRNIDRFGPAFDAQETTEISAALHETFASSHDARLALSAAIDEGRIDPAAALRLCHSREVRSSRLLADSMGALAGAHFAPLE